jgi:hypothetical protein
VFRKPLSPVKNNNNNNNVVVSRKQPNKPVQAPRPQMVFKPGDVQAMRARIMAKKNMTEVITEGLGQAEIQPIWKVGEPLKTKMGKWASLGSNDLRNTNTFKTQKLQNQHNSILERRNAWRAKNPRWVNAK